jgi:shikimate kinase / 3-dehydroquinate synthase
MADAIVLVGLSGSGKSTLAAALASRLGRPLVDLDVEIAEREDSHPARIIEDRGEAAFRAIESAAVARACAIDGAIIATGGGAVVDPLNRWALWHAGHVVWLDAPDEVLLSRLAGHHEPRPMLAGDATAALAALRAARAPHHRAADTRLDASAPVSALAETVAGAVAAGRPRARRLFDARVRRDHPMGPPDGRVLMGTALDGPTYEDVLRTASSGIPVVVADRRAAQALPDLMASLPAARRLLIRSGERNKRLRTVERLLESASTMGAERGDAWVGVGGGATTDMVGTAAALYVRGANFVAVATTWLGMTDAAIGGKVAVDLSAAKNAAGAFWPPVAIVGDVASLRTLPRARRLDGMAESLKSGIIGDPALWALAEARGKAALRGDESVRYALIERAAALKLSVVERDPFERGERRALNLGHTLGHALEIESGYRLPHGMAVVLGLRAVTHIATGRRVAAPGLAERIDQVVRDLGYDLTRSFDAAVVKRALTSDKKRERGRQHWILPLDIGRVVDVDDVTETELDRAIAHISGEGAR